MYFNFPNGMNQYNDYNMDSRGNSMNMGQRRLRKRIPSGSLPSCPLPSSGPGMRMRVPWQRANRTHGTYRAIFIRKAYYL